jgi:hypothetical protein
MDDEPQKIEPDMKELFEGTTVVPDKIVLHYRKKEHGVYSIARKLLSLMQWLG